MLRISPAHISVVYPEETVDTDLLLDRLARVTDELAAFPLRLAAVAGEAGGRRGVHALVEDPGGGLEALRDRLLLPPQRFSGYPFHATVAHPRTAPSPTACWTQLRGVELDAAFTVDHVLWTVTDESGRRILRRFTLAGRATRVAMAAGVLVRDGQVLLALRCQDRSLSPGVWDLPGGHVERGESPRRALRRELREELGIEARLEAPWRHLVDDGLGSELSVWRIEHWRGTISNLAHDEHDRLHWFAPAELGRLALAHPTYPQLLSDAIDG